MASPGDSEERKSLLHERKIPTSRDPSDQQDEIEIEMDAMGECKNYNYPLKKTHSSQPATHDT